MRGRRSNSASSVVSSASITDPGRNSTCGKGPVTEEIENNRDNQTENVIKNNATSNLPKIDLTLSVDRRRQSIEGSIIMADAYNNNSATISSAGANGDVGYDSGSDVSITCIHFK